MNKADVVAMICSALSEVDTSKTGAIAHEHYPFTPGMVSARRYSERQQLEVFLRDGFTDRYSGEKLLFPGTLRLLSRILPRVPVSSQLEAQHYAHGVVGTCPNT
jgi:hypothetical protein